MYKKMIYYDNDDMLQTSYLNLNDKYDESIYNHMLSTYDLYDEIEISKEEYDNIN